MTATNHALTGALIGLSVGSFVAIPLAFVSHFILDAMPHFGAAASQQETLRSRWFKNYLVVEAILCLAIVVLLAILQPTYWLLAAICAFLAASPDLFSIRRYLTVRAGKEYRPSLYGRFASKIQWFEKPVGAYVEVIYFGAIVWLLVNILTI